MEHFGEDRFKILFSEEFMAISKIHLPKTVKPLDRLPIFEEDCINRCKDRKWTLPYKRNSKEHRVMKDELHPLISNQFLREHQERRATNTNELKSIYEQDQKTNLLTKTAKKESILKDCSSNVLNFDIDSMKQSS